MDKSSNTDRLLDKPEPSDLLNFLPWACAQMQLPKDVHISKNFQHEYVSTVASERGKTGRGKSRPKLPSVPDMADADKEEASANFTQDTREIDVVRINAIYDFTDNLVGLKFDKNASIPRALIQILGLIIKFQIYLTSITINQGLNKYVMHEIVNLLPRSKITELCFDNCFLSECTYYTVLEINSNLRSLSLSRCRINDEAVALIADRLSHTKPGANNLVILNLSSNRITDVGAKEIRAALKTNNRLTYLNLADNLITDEGAATILNVLMEFPITKPEITETRTRHIQYMRNRNNVIRQIAVDLRMTDVKVRKMTISRPRGKGKDKDVDSLAASDKSMFVPDALFYEKAQMIADTTMKPFQDPYSLENVTTRDGITYCLGNNTLALLNLSYNNLSWTTLQKLLEVLTYQRDMDRKPKGLLNCRLEGNPLPVGCKEMSQIEELLESGLSGPAKRNTVMPKKKGK